MLPGPLILNAQLAEQTRRRDHDPRDECDHAGKQQHFTQDSGHSNPPARTPSRGHRALQHLGQKVTADCSILAIKYS